MIDDLPPPPLGRDPMEEGGGRPTDLAKEIDSSTAVVERLQDAIQGSRLAHLVDAGEPAAGCNRSFIVHVGVLYHVGLLRLSGSLDA